MRRRCVPFPDRRARVPRQRLLQSSRAASGERRLFRPQKGNDHDHQHHHARRGRRLPCRDCGASSAGRARRRLRLPVRGRRSETGRRRQKRCHASAHPHSRQEAGDRCRHLRDLGRYGTGRHADDEGAGEGDAGFPAWPLRRRDRTRHGRQLGACRWRPRCRARRETVRASLPVKLGK